MTDGPKTPAWIDAAYELANVWAVARPMIQKGTYGDRDHNPTTHDVRRARNILQTVDDKASVLLSLNGTPDSVVRFAEHCQRHAVGFWRHGESSRLLEHYWCEVLDTIEARELVAP